MPETMKASTVATALFVIVSFISVVKGATPAPAKPSNSDHGYTCPAKQALAVSTSDEEYKKRPFVDGAKTFIGGKVKAFSGPSKEVTSPIVDEATGKSTVIGKMAQMSEADAMAVVESSKTAWGAGQGTWPQMTSADRIKALENVLDSLVEIREEMVNVLMWEICKTKKDAAAEFDRTIVFAKAVIQAFKDDAAANKWMTVSKVMAKVRRAAIGIVLCLGPFNYPINETYATLLPALLSGNVVILKVPTLGGLAHILTMQAFAKHLPAGAINFLSGSGRSTMGPVMRTGSVDVLAFIGGSSAADAIIKEHPNPHRLKSFLQLEGKNPGIILPDANLDSAADEVCLGATSYNGQRCTAIKMTFVHRSVADVFMQKLATRVNALKGGLPWAEGVSITPLPEPSKPRMLQDWIGDAISKGAKLFNADQGGGEQAGALCTPAIMYPVTEKMRLWHEEQFGPVIPVAVFDHVSEVVDYIAKAPFGQQAAIFTATPEGDASILVDALATVVGRININAQCGRSPDVYPFSGRRSSALGTMSIKDSVSVFSTETVIATKEAGKNIEITKGLEKTTRILADI